MRTKEEGDAWLAAWAKWSARVARHDRDWTLYPPGTVRPVRKTFWRRVLRR